MLRPRLLPVHLLRPRAFHSAEHTSPPLPYNPFEQSILSSAVQHVPEHGFSSTALLHGARDAGYLDISANVFPRRAFELVHYWLRIQRRQLKVELTEEMGAAAKIRALCVARLKANGPIVHQWTDALALMSLAENVPASLGELAKLSGDMWAIAGDASVDTAWYSKRAMLAGVYASTEVFMTQDGSRDFEETWRFLDRRLEDVKKVGQTAGNVGEWVGFTGRAVVNLARSKGVIF